MINAVILILIIKELIATTILDIHIEKVHPQEHTHLFRQIEKWLFAENAEKLEKQQ